jgi:predicted hydrolase (HD superfamily)
LGEDPVLIQAVAAHYEAKTGVAPQSDLDKHLFACDELSGFVVACVYVRPSKSVMDLEVKSVRKKLKTPAFAAAVSRDDIEQGAAMIGLDLDEHIGNVIRFLQAEADALGLAGSTP